MMDGFISRIADSQHDCRFYFPCFQIGLDAIEQMGKQAASSYFVVIFTAA